MISAIGATSYGTLNKTEQKPVAESAGSLALGETAGSLAVNNVGGSFCIMA